MSRSLRQRAVMERYTATRQAEAAREAAPRALVKKHRFPAAVVAAGAVAFVRATFRTALRGAP